MSKYGIYINTSNRFSSLIDILNKYLESLWDDMKYGKWFYAHLYDNRQVFESNYLLYEQIVRIN